MKYHFSLFSQKVRVSVNQWFIFYSIWDKSVSSQLDWTDCGFSYELSALCLNEKRTSPNQIKLNLIKLSQTRNFNRKINAKIDLILWHTGNKTLIYAIVPGINQKKKWKVQNNKWASNDWIINFCLKIQFNGYCCGVIQKDQANHSVCFIYSGLLFPYKIIIQETQQQQKNSILCIENG